MYVCMARYGALEGLSKPELAAVYGEEMVQKWRSGLVDRYVCMYVCMYEYIIMYVCGCMATRPPSMTPEHMHYHNKELKYAQVVQPNLK